MPRTNCQLAKDLKGRSSASTVPNSNCYSNKRVNIAMVESVREASDMIVTMQAKSCRGCIILSKTWHFCTGVLHWLSSSHNIIC